MTDGDNFAYTRVHRKKLGSVQDVNLHFLYSEYGIGNNYVDAGSTDGSLHFGIMDMSKTLTSGYRWHLPANNSHHNCLAVEISTPRDPLIQPSLAGRVPGWSNGTDLMVFNDNNKAQRNMGLYTAPVTSGTPMPPAGTSGTGTMSMAIAVMYVLIHNPTLELIDIHIKPVIDPIAGVKPIVTVMGNKGEQSTIARPNRDIILKKMKPGEARFLKISYGVPKGKEGKSFSLTYNQVKNEVVVNAFTILNQYASMDKVVKENLRYEAGVFGRINALYKEMDTALLIKQINKNISEKNLSSKDYQNYLKENIPLMRSVTRQLVSMEKNHPFGLSSAINVLEQQIKNNNAIKTANAHLSLLNTIDAYLTSLQLEKGNAADILQTVYLQREILKKIESKNTENSVKHLLDLSNKFISDYEKRKLTIADYPAQVKKMLNDLNDLAIKSGKNDSRLLNSLETMQQKKDPVELQGEHIKFLLLLKDLTQQ